MVLGKQSILCAEYTCKTKHGPLSLAAVVFHGMKTSQNVVDITVKFSFLHKWPKKHTLFDFVTLSKMYPRSHAADYQNIRNTD